jgi:prepilin-type N-terminal cleavage/methylation domain-containing protein
MRLLSSSALRRVRPLRAAFTLVELLAVIAIISILMAFLLPKIPEMIDAAKVTACKKNLQEIYKGIGIYEIKYNRLPNKPGVRFFSTLISRGALENTKTSAMKLTCPAPDIGSLAGISDIEPELWFADAEAIDGTFSSYAGRDTDQYPLKRMTGKEPLVADDNDDGVGNHMTTTNVLYGDGAVNTFELALEIENGNVDPEAEFIIVGPDSNIEDLQKFSLD